MGNTYQGTAKLKRPGRMGQAVVDFLEKDDDGDIVARQRALSHDTLSMLQKRGTIDQEHVAAGLRYAVLVEKLSAGSSLAALDPNRIQASTPTSGGLSFVQLDSLDRLNKINKGLGLLNHKIIYAICAENLTLPELADRFAGPPLRWPRSDYAGARVREAFEVLREIVR